MKKLHLIYLVLLVTGAVLAVVLSGSTSQAPGRKGARGKKSLRVPTPRRRPRCLITGHVQTAEGKPVKGATVFVLPKKKKGASRDDLPHEVTDGEGRWSLGCKQTVDCWIGVVAGGYRTAWLDGDKLDPKVQMFLVIERATPLRVRLIDAKDQPLEEQGVQLEPWPRGQFHLLPGPESRQGEQWGVSDEDGNIVFRRGATGPVTLQAHVEGFHTRPETTWLPDASGEVVLRLFRSADLHVRLTDSKTGGPLSGLVTVDLHDAATGRPVGSVTDMTQRPGEMLFERMLAPGHYFAVVQMEGRAPVLLENVRVGKTAQTVSLKASLDTALENGRLEVSLQAEGPAPVAPADGRPGQGDGARPRGAGGARRGRRRRRTPLTFLLHNEAGWRRLGWIPGSPENWDPARRHLSYAPLPGRYHLLVADVLTGRTAIIKDVVIEPGKTRTLKVAMKAGLSPTLPPLRNAGNLPRTLTISSAAWPALPVYGSTADRRTRMGQPIDVIARHGAGAAIRLGPYPAESISLSIRGWDGATRVVEFP